MVAVVSSGVLKLVEMQLPRDPSNEGEAAAFAVVAVMRLASYMMISGAFSMACVPDKGLVLLSMIGMAAPESARPWLRVVFHVGAVAMLLGTAGTMLVHWMLLLIRTPALRGVEEFVCQADALSVVYGDPPLVQALSALVVLVFVSQFVDRAAALVIGAPAMTWAARMGRAGSSAVLWLAVSDASALAPFVALTIGVDLCIMHAVEVAAHLSAAHKASRMDVQRVAVSALAGLLLMYAGALARLCDQRRVAACSVLLGSAYCLPLAGDIVWACATAAFFGKKEE